MQRKLDNLESIPNEFIAEIEAMEKGLADEITGLLSELEIVGGKIATTESNLAKVNDIMTRLQNEMFDKDYFDALKKLMKGFDQQAEMNNELFGELFDDFSDKSIFEKVLENAKDRTLKQLDVTQVEAVYSPMRDLITQAVIGEATFAETVKAVRNQLITENGGLMTQHVKTVVRDSFAQADREYTQIVSNTLGIEYFQYAGGTLKDSREFCLERVGQIFHISEIKSWANDDWQGKNYDTTEFNIFTLLGGYNCIHSLLPVSRENVPDYGLKRNS